MDVEATLEAMWILQQQRDNFYEHSLGWDILNSALYHLRRGLRAYLMRGEK